MSLWWWENCVPRLLTEDEKRRVDELRAVSEVEAIDSVMGGKGRIVGIVRTDPNEDSTSPDAKRGTRQGAQRQSSLRATEGDDGG